GRREWNRRGGRRGDDRGQELGRRERRAIERHDDAHRQDRPHRPHETSSTAWAVPLRAGCKQETRLRKRAVAPGRGSVGMAAERRQGFSDTRPGGRPLDNDGVTGYPLVEPPGSQLPVAYSS